SACTRGEGVTAEGDLVWTGGGARYVYVLEEGAANPGPPPNLDLPDGTVWRVDVPPSADPMESPLKFGALPASATQRFPAAGVAPDALVSGRTYYVYAMADVAIPITRCLFVAP
ncbi:MAG: proteinase inhibitor, partial [Myxococcota bacterium]